MKAVGLTSNSISAWIFLMFKIYCLSLNDLTVLRDGQVDDLCCKGYAVENQLLNQGHMHCHKKARGSRAYFPANQSVLVYEECACCRRVLFTD